MSNELKSTAPYIMGQLDYRGQLVLRPKLHRRRYKQKSAVMTLDQYFCAREY